MKAGKGSPQHKASRRESKTRSSDQEEDDATCMSVDQDGIARGGVATPFPWKLHEMLEDSAKEGNEWIVSWQSHGRSFLVHKPKLFVEKIMPTYFNQSKFASFQRQLNLYGFSRLTTGRDKGAYYHSCFVRGQRGLCRGMIRQKIKGTKVRRTLAPEEEPNFYQMTTTHVPDSPTQPMPPLEGSSNPPVEATKVSKARRRSSTSSISACNRINIISAKDRALQLRQDQLDAVRDALKRTDILSDVNFDVGHYDRSFNDSEVPVLPSVSPIDSEESDAEDSVAVVSPPRGQQQQRLSSLPQALVENEVETITPRIHDIHVKGGDLLFFEGKPFHYLEHLDSLPPVPSMLNNPTKQGAQAPYPALRDSLQSLIRNSPQAIMGVAFNVCQIP